MASRLRQALDVSSSPPSNKQLLTWDSATGKWTPKTVTPSDIGAAEDTHTHAGSDITSAVAQADNADTVDGLDSTAFALSDHSHADATTTDSGFMSATDKQKLDGLGSATPKTALCGLGLSLTDTYQSIQGMSLTIDKAGTWLIVLTAVAEYDSTDSPNEINVRLSVGGVAQMVLLRINSTASTALFTSTQHWTYTASDDTPLTVTAEAQKEGGTGTSQILSGSTHMTAIWLSA